LRLQAAQEENHHRESAKERKREKEGENGRPRGRRKPLRESTPFFFAFSLFRVFAMIPSLFFAFSAALRLFDSFLPDALGRAERR
jgi:hypothetical protein